MERLKASFANFFEVPVMEAPRAIPWLAFELEKKLFSDLEDCHQLLWLLFLDVYNAFRARSLARCGVSGPKAKQEGSAIDLSKSIRSCDINKDRQTLSLSRADSYKRNLNRDFLSILSMDEANGRGKWGANVSNAKSHRQGTRVITSHDQGQKNFF